MPSKSATSKISSLYRFLWAFPIQGRLLGLVIPLSIATSIGITYIGGFGTYSPLVIAGFLLSVLVNWILDRFELGLLNLRRANQITILNSIFVAAGCLAALFKPIGVVGLAAIVTIGSFLRTLVYLSLSGKSLPKSMSFLFPMMILEAAPPVFLLNNKVYGVALAGGYVIGCCAALTLILILDKLIHINGISLWNYLSSILAVLLDEKGDWFEKIAEKLDGKAEIRVDMLCFRDLGGVKPGLVVLIPTFHPGPFRNFGSSKLLYEIAEKLGSEGVDVVFFKGPSNHEQNVITSEDCEKITRGIVGAVEESRESVYKSSASYPKEILNGDAKGLLMSIGGSKIIFLTRHPRGMEDIPPSILKEIGDESLIPVDAHNSFSEDVRDLDDRGVEEFLKILEKASMESLVENSPLLLGYSRSAVEGFSREDGVGDLGISVLVLGHKDALAAVVSLDGNNCLPEVRDAIFGELRSFGFKAVEVMTTDTHVVNGLKFGGRGYHPLGEVVPANLLAKKSFEAAKSALENTRPMEVTRIRLTFKDVRVMSSNFLEEGAVKAYRGLISFLSFLAASAALGYLWGFFLL
ncbi:MAG: DUF2070 family protein [Nitrososphaerota archaeon]|nr:DUF2070 family protein [Nitrososphaerota archaeon]